MVHALNEVEDTASRFGEERTSSGDSSSYSSEAENNPYIIDPIFIQINKVSKEADKVYTNLMTLRGTRLSAKVDTRAQANILPVRIFDKLFQDWSKVKPSSVVLQGYNECHLENLEIVGIKLKPTLGPPKFHTVSFYITKQSTVPILGKVAKSSIWSDSAKQYSPRM